MLCKVADLVVDVPEQDGLYARCREYLQGEKIASDIVIRSDLYRREKYPPGTSDSVIAYMESAYQFYLELVRYGGFFLHASCVVRDGKAYLFSGHQRAGKSTHTRLWLDTFGGDTRIINDDKPALRRIEGRWYAYGTPWCGKDGINLNECAPVAGVCFLEKADHNAIRRLPAPQALTRILSQTIYHFTEPDKVDLLVELLNSFLMEIPVFELENLPESAAAQLSYETMSQEAKL